MGMVCKRGRCCVVFCGVGMVVGVVSALFWFCGGGGPVARAHGFGLDVSTAWFGIALCCPVSPLLPHLPIPSPRPGSLLAILHPWRLGVSCTYIYIYIYIYIYLYV